MTDADQLRTIRRIVAEYTVDTDTHKILAARLLAAGIDLDPELCALGDEIAAREGLPPNGDDSHHFRLTHIEPRNADDQYRSDMNDDTPLGEWPNLDADPTAEWTVDPALLAAISDPDSHDQDGHDTAGPHHDHTTDPW